MKAIKSIIKLTNIYEYNKHHNKKYLNKTGVLIIEFEDNTKYILDIQSMTDISNCNYIDINIQSGKTKIKYLFKNILFDT